MSRVEGQRRVGRPPDSALPGRRTEEILAAATVLFATYGFTAADTQSLADQLGIGKGTIYRYFNCKQDLFLATVDRAMRHLLAEVDGATESVADPLQRVSCAIRAYLGFFDRNPHFVELLIQDRAHFRDRQKPLYFQYQDANIGRWKTLFQELIQAKRVRNVPVERITTVIGNLVYGTMFTNYFAGRSASLESQAEEILDIVFHGILLEPVRKSAIPPKPRRSRPL
jgi:AcrR family transcriptional regulator